MDNKLTTEDYYDQIDHAATVAAVAFRAFGWTYIDGVPTHNELEETITELVDHVLEYADKPDFDGRTAVSSGRFTVSYQEYDDERELSIDLNLASKSQFKEETWSK